ncbi:MAG: DUF4920 domain-containing protein [Planctomycetota bacterium]|nr:DUF4920 domain-containing protein [Planctomycetota bacterium]
MRCLSILALATAVVACQGPKEDHATMDHAGPTSQPVVQAATGDLSVPIASPVPGWVGYGDSFDAAKVSTVVTFADVAADPAAFDGQPVTVRATIEEVCQSKGCWMTFNEGGESMRVKFKDYAFFMPMDSQGKEVLVDGTFAIQVVPAEEAAHYLEDAGKHEEAAAITEDQVSLTFLASSVLMKK